MNILATICVLFQLLLVCVLLTGIPVIIIVWFFGRVHAATSPRKQRS